MTNEVKPLDDPHVATLIAAVFARFTATFPEDEWDGLRPAHFRVIEAVGRDGTRATDLARSLAMTKQGAGQLVARLVDGGWLEQLPDPDDRRARRLALTRSGRRVLDRLEAHIGAIETQWEREVGRADYGVFVDVLARLAAGSAAEKP